MALKQEKIFRWLDVEFFFLSYKIQNFVTTSLQSGIYLLRFLEQHNDATLLFKALEDSLWSSTCIIQLIRNRFFSNLCN